MNLRNGLAHCRTYQNFESNLNQLNRFWDSVTTIGYINSNLLQGQATPLLESLSQTREDFTDLQRRLLESLVFETLGKAQSELNFLAQNGIDVLIRNLFERTADVGFLAVDGRVIDYLKASDAEQRPRLEKRLQDYVAKYSVYDEILILDKAGRVTAQLDPSNEGARFDARITQGIDHCTEYFEYLGYTSYYPERPMAHLFGCPVSDPVSGEHLGYLVMFFKFEDELERIRAQLLGSDSDCTLVLLDEEMKTLYTSDPNLVPLGQRVAQSDGTLDHPLMIRDQAYLSVTRKTQGYQGYLGLPWQARALIPISKAMDVPLKKRSRASDEQMQAMSASLMSIYRDSEQLNRKLRMVTVNGKSLASRLDVKTFIPILEKIQEVGTEITAIISQSISLLNQTVTQSLLSNCRLYSALAIDIMDRNLYERANDCRWWALTPSFRDVFENGDQDVSEDQRASIQSTLAFINELYTVYTDLLVFDREGTILAASQAQCEGTQPGKQLHTDRLVAETLRLADQQQYSVSDFELAPEYGNKPTYIYCAAIRDQYELPSAGVAVVFDAEPEFEAMLEASLPVDAEGQVMSGAAGLYVTPAGRVISSTSDEFKPGDRVELPSQIAQLQDGESYAAETEFAGKAMLLGATRSSGYREYKTVGSYTNPVIALILIRK